MPQTRDRLLSVPKLPQFKGAAAKTGVPPDGEHYLVGSEPLVPLGLSSLGYASYIEQPTMLLAHGPAMS